MTEAFITADARLDLGLNAVEDGVYVDTPENRQLINNNLERYPEYKLVKLYGFIPDEAEPHAIA